MADTSKRMVTAVRNGEVQKVKSFIESYGLSFCEDWQEGYALLCEALKFTRKEMAKLLMANDCKVNRGTPGGSCTPLHLAVRLQDEDIARMLLEKGADINATFGDKKQTPLHEAIVYNKVDMIKLLLGYGADYNQEDARHQSPVDLAAQSGGVLLLKYAMGDDVQSLMECLRRNC